MFCLAKSSTEQETFLRFWFGVRKDCVEAEGELYVFIATKLAGGPLMALQLHQHTCKFAGTLLQHPTLCSSELEPSAKEAPQVNAGRF